MRSFSKTLFSLVLIFCGLTSYGQAGARLELVQPSIEDACDGQMKILSIQDCGVPGFQLWSDAHGELKEGQIVNEICSSEFELSWTDSSGRWFADVLVPNWGSQLDTLFSEFECFDSTYYAPDIEVYGTMRSTKDSVSWSDVRILITGESGYRSEVEVDSTGYYEMFLPVFDLYTLTYRTEGHYTKMLRMDSHIKNVWRVGSGYSMSVDMRMIPKVDGLDLKMLDEAISTATHDPESNQFIWDTERAKRIAKEVKEALGTDSE